MLVYQALADARRLARVIEPFDPLPFLHMAEALGRAAAAQSELARGARPDQTWRELKRELYPLSRLFRSAGFDRIVRRLAAARKDAFASYSMPIALMLWDLFDSVITTREALAHLAEAIDLETSNNQNASPSEESIAVATKLASDALGSALQLQMKLSFLRGWTAAWLEFDVPSSEEPKTHLIALRFPSGALSAAQCAAWFDAVDGAYKLALIDDPSVPTPIIERFESGSIWQWVKDVPESAVPALKEMFRRLVLPEQTKLQTLAQSADLLADLTDKVAAGRLAPADADLIRHKVLRIAEVLPPGQQILLQIDNEPIVAGEVPPTLPRADQKALPPSTRTRRRRPVN